MKKVLAFGTFDGIHEGHRWFLKRAKALGSHLTIIVAPDAAVKALKGRRARFPLPARMRFLKKEGLADKVAPGDRKQGSWDVLKKHHPHVIALGYDQRALRKALSAEIKSLRPRPRLASMGTHHPTRYHSRILLRRNPQHRKVQHIK
jgi:cytidyltransferase-like protein